VLDNLSRGHRAAVAAEVPFYAGDIGDTEFGRKHRTKNIASKRAFISPPFAYVGESVAETAR
jgi:UDP-glucose 4-epimerase